jgi:hypothetical protein
MSARLLICVLLIFILANRSAMPDNLGKPDYYRCEQPNPITPTKAQRNAWAGHNNADPKIPNACPIPMSHSIRKRECKLINRSGSGT